MQVTFMDIGATWLSCILPLPGEEREVLLGVSTMSGFNKQSSYMGVTVGRYANRIAKGQFAIDGEYFQVETNQAGNTLHGGPEGLDKRRWGIEEQGIDFVQFATVSPDGDQGFPGELSVSVRYQLTDDNKLSISYNAVSDKATPVNLTNHAYFNLLGAESGLDCKSHQLEIAALEYLPTNEVGIPLGELAPVIGTSFDFRQMKAVAQDFLAGEQQQAAKGYDHSFMLDPERDSSDCVARVSLPDESVSMSVYTDKPAMQLYTGNWLAGTPNRSDGCYSDYAGLALETQFLPDSPNHLEWQQPDCILKPGEQYSYTTQYRFDF
jgi:aldose 1-epimerase